MSAIKKPVTALLGVVAMLLAGLFFAVSPASATAPAAAAPAAIAAPYKAPGSGYGGTTIVITISITTNPDGSTTITITIAVGFKPGETVIINIHSKEYQLGTTTANAKGGISSTVTIPASFKGSHTIELVGATSGVRASQGIQLGSGSTTTGGSSGSGGGLSSTGVAVVGIGALGVVLLVGGGMLLFVGRRRKLGEI